MFNTDKLDALVKDYGNFMGTEEWKRKERYKWVAVKHFQDNWDIEAADFHAMLTESLAKTFNLLASNRFYPRGVLEELSEAFPEEIRILFIQLFDEKLDVSVRIVSFQAGVSELWKEFRGDNPASHYQNTNSISTYLWLKYPDKYYIYKYKLFSGNAELLDSDYRPRPDGSAASAVGGFEFYSQIAEYLQQNTNLAEQMRKNLSPECYADPHLNTLTIDLGYYARNYHQLNTDGEIDVSNKSEEWSPASYHPGIDTEQWLELLEDKTVFTDNGLMIMKRLKDYGGAATCTQLSIKYGESFNFYNSGSSRLAQRVAAKSNCQLPDESLGDNYKWWPILYVGKPARKTDRGSYIWKLRPELSAALDQFNLESVPLFAGTAAAEPVSTSAPRLISAKQPYTRESFLKEVYMSPASYDTLVSLLKRKLNVIIQGAPGVGKTFAAKRLAWSLMGEIDNSRIEFVQFHQNYTYEDFIMGYRPQGEGFELQYGIFYRFCQRAQAAPDQDFFFIIDEINRGNLSKIFGELLMLIEKDYRGQPITLAYDGLVFSVPENIYIIGLMNTADRSLAMIDYALRRRFSFFEMEPGFQSEGFRVYQNKMASDELDAIILKIQELNKAIAADTTLGAGFCIGHSYFCNQKEAEAGWEREVVQYEIIPMLSEYWFDDPDKLADWKIRLLESS